MKTVFHTVIDGYDIVLGFSDPQMDPVATSAKTSPLIAALDEQKQAQSIAGQLAEARQRARYASDQIQIARSANNQIAIASQVAAFEQAQKEADQLASELQPVLAAIAEKSKAIMLANPVWFSPGHAVGPDGTVVREDLIPETDVEYGDGKAGHVTYSTLTAAMADDPHVQLLVDGTKVADFRDSVVWSHSGTTWSKRVISKLGDKPGAGEILERELTPEQRSQINGQLEADRVAALTGAQKLAEGQTAQAAAKSAVIRVQNEFALGISTQEQLAAAVAAYKEQLAEINAKYGTNLT